MSHQVIAVTSEKRQKNDLIGSVQRALAIMELLAQHPTGLIAKQVSFQTQLNLATCYHLLNTLIDSGYVIKDPETLAFRLSGKIGYTVHGQATSAQLVKQLTPHVQSLQEATHETAYLSLWDGEHITISSIIEGPQTVRVKSLTIGYREANHAMALGKAILAYLEPARLEVYLSRQQPLPAYTPNTITDPATLKLYLEQVRQQRYALDLEEYLPDVHCIGAPIFDAQDAVIASIAISLPASRSEKNRQSLLAKVMQAAAAATWALDILGYVGLSNGR
jgi:DNA-binding IclR family transcriptional regulator